jgi:hypothetical protein
MKSKSILRGGTIIRVPRSIRPIYPRWVKEIIHPELQDLGPETYDLAKIELYLHDAQKEWIDIPGTMLFRHIEKTDRLKRCLGLRDALMIEKINVTEAPEFSKIFGHDGVSQRDIFCWKSVVRSEDGKLYVPGFSTDGSRVAVDWDSLENNWICNDFAAMFSEEQMKFRA